LALPRRPRRDSVARVSDTTSIWFWIAFHLGVFAALTIDLINFRHRTHDISIRGAIIRSATWVALSLGFNWIVLQLKGADDALDFFTGYVIEYSLSVDNIFLFVVIFTYFKVPPRAQQRVLLWGILSALVMRGLMIWLGIALVERFHWILYVFGLFLIITAARMLFGGEKEMDLDANTLVRLARRTLPMTQQYERSRFVTRVKDHWCFTPLVIVLILINVMDLVFAVDSIPAVFAITTDRFIVYTSNICAILGLRSLYFLLAHLVDRFIYLKTGLAFVLGFVGAKMIAAKYVHIPNGLSLGVIILILTITITASLIATKGRTRRGETEELPPDAQND
jgi:tellurite resistance protein TerC